MPRVQRPFLKSFGLCLGLTLAALCSAAGADNSLETYTVKPGDTAYSVAKMAGTDVATLLKLNALASADLKLGQLLRLPAGPALPAARTHTVGAGQTLYSVARLYGLKAADLQVFNHLPGPDLKAGQVLLLPPDPEAQATPRPTPVPVAVALRPEPAPRYTVQPGQTLYGIARLYGLRPDDLLALNHLTGSDLHAGQVLVLPVGAVAQAAPSLPASGPGMAVPAGALLSPGIPLPPPPVQAPRSDLPQPGINPAAVSPAAAESGWRALAMSLLGVPYQYGGQSRSGTDCSGLVIQVFGPLGLNLPRQSAVQAQTGMMVEQRDLQPGDLLFFDTEGRGEVTHVGIYLGDGQFINANSYGGEVAVNQLSDKYFAQRYLWARRVLGVLAQGH